MDFQNGEHPWHKLERGEVTMEEAAKVLPQSRKRRNQGIRY